MNNDIESYALDKMKKSYHTMFMIEKVRKHCLLFFTLLMLGLVSCGGGDDEVENPKDKFPPLEKPTATTALSLENAPVTDGSDSTEPLRTLLMCRLLGIDCKWMEDMAYTLTWRIFPDYSSLSSEQRSMLSKKLLNWNTHQSFMECIDGRNDIIITARGISRDESQYAKEKGVELLSRPIAKDAFAFIVNASNPVTNLTIEQVKKIYMGEITNWKEVGGDDAPIVPYVRNANSGSQEKMETVVMAGLTMPDWKELTLYTMISPYIQLESDPNGICYTPFYYFNSIVRPESVKVISLDGTTPSRKTIKDDTYPYVTEVMCSVRSDVDKSSTAYQLFYNLSTGKHNQVIDESGYVVYAR